MTYRGVRHCTLLLVAAPLSAAEMAAFAGAATSGEPAAGRPDWNGVWVIADSLMDKQDGTEVAAPGRLDAAAQARLVKQTAADRH